MKKVIITFFSILMLSQVYSQTFDTIIPKLTESEFGKLKLEYKKMCQSSLFKKEQSLHKVYLNKIPFIVSLNDKTEEEFTKSISVYLSQSEFKTIEEAIDFRRKYYKIKEKLEVKYRDVFKLIYRATQAEMKIIMDLN